MRVSQIATFLASLAGVIAAPLEPRAVINHDAVVGFAQAVPSGSLGTALLKFKPWLYVVNGCVPFPAVDAAGNTGYVPMPFQLAKHISTNHYSPTLVAVWPLPEARMAAAAPARDRYTPVVRSMATTTR